MAVYNMTFSFLAYLLLISIKIGCLGHFMLDTIVQVGNACEMMKKTVRSLFEQAVRIAVSCSDWIYNFRASLDWDLSVCPN